MTIISLTGTPGTGKTTMSQSLRDCGYNVVDLSAFIRENGLLGEYDSEMGSYDVDVAKLDEALKDTRDSEELVFLEGHLSHFLTCDKIIVLRCHPGVLENRLESRGYDREKVLENIQAEVLDVILYEASEKGVPVFELDSTAGNNLSDVEEIIRGECDRYLPGSISWGEEMERWF